MNGKRTRDPALDIIRSIALLCVICVHFFWNTEFYETTVTGRAMLIMSVMRSCFIICVPLFMMLTGYLIKSKEINKGYYLKIVRILYTYVMASLVCGLFSKNVLLDSTILGVILGIFTYEAAPYSWYVEMYIGFFLLIPFLNTMYDGLDTRRKKQLLVITLLLLTALARAVFSKISDLSLGAYLTSWVFDIIIYTGLNESVPTLQQKLAWFPVVTALVFIGSLICAYVIDLSYTIFVKRILQRYTRQTTAR